MASYWFRVYVAGKSERTDAAVRNLRTLCESRVHGAYELEVIDVLERPDLAVGDAIVIAPTVVRVVPWPQRRIYGGLSDQERAGAALGLPESDVLASTGGDRGPDG